jgi:murein DD-endopeptidase MepM/ murein hydrolase activator NlpD
VPCECIGVAPGIASLDVGERRLGDEGTETDVLSFLLEEHELLFGNRELGAHALQTFTDIDEAALKDRPRHDERVYDRRRAERPPGSSGSDVHPSRHGLPRVDTPTQMLMSARSAIHTWWRRRFATVVALVLTTGAVGLLVASPVHAADDDPQPKRDGLALAQEQLDAAREQATEVAKKLDDAQAQQAQLQAQIADAEQKIPELQSQADTLRLAVKLRAIQLYVTHGQKLDQLLATEGVVDAARAAQLTEIIAQHDVDLAAELRDTAQQLADREDQLKTQRAALQQTIDSLAPLQDQLLKQLATANDLYENVKAAVDAAHADGKNPDAATGATRCPVNGFVVFTDDFGVDRPGGQHPGVDMPALPETPVVAVVGGMMTHDVGGDGGNGAWLIGIDGVGYYYAHFSRYEGDSRLVSAGDVIGYVGATGNATGPHLHFEMHPGGWQAPPVDPYPMLLALCVKETSKPLG